MLIMKNKQTTHTSLLLTHILYTQSEYLTGLSVHVAQRVAGNNFMNIKMFTVKDSAQKWLKILKKSYLHLCQAKVNQTVQEQQGFALCKLVLHIPANVRIKRSNYLTDFNI